MNKELETTSKRQKKKYLSFTGLVRKASFRITLKENLNCYLVLERMKKSDTTGFHLYVSDKAKEEKEKN